VPFDLTLLLNASPPVGQLKPMYRAHESSHYGGIAEHLPFPETRSLPTDKTLHSASRILARNPSNTHSSLLPSPVPSTAVGYPHIPAPSTVLSFLHLFPAGLGIITWRLSVYVLGISKLGQYFPETELIRHRISAVHLLKERIPCPIHQYDPNQ
jgi:hypothetical protein